MITELLNYWKHILNYWNHNQCSFSCTNSIIKTNCLTSYFQIKWSVIYVHRFCLDLYWTRLGNFEILEKMYSNSLGLLSNIFSIMNKPCAKQSKMIYWIFLKFWQLFKFSASKAPSSKDTSMNSEQKRKTRYEF